MSETPDALWRLWSEFDDAEPQAVFGGIYANKRGYHNTRNNLRNQGRWSDYSIQAAADKRGPGDKAAAVDITFRDAQASRFGTIAKYTRRVINAMRDRDKRLFHGGAAVWREVFGNADLDREVEGWSLYRGYAVSSDSSHLWHIHLSCHRQFVENEDAVEGMLAILLDKPVVIPAPKPDPEPKPEQPKDWWDTVNKNEAQEVMEAAIEAKMDRIAGRVLNTRFATGVEHLDDGPNGGRNIPWFLRDTRQNSYAALEALDAVTKAVKNLAAAELERAAVDSSERSDLAATLESLQTATEAIRAAIAADDPQEEDEAGNIEDEPTQG